MTELFCFIYSTVLKKPLNELNFNLSLTSQVFKRNSFFNRINQKRLGTEYFISSFENGANDNGIPFQQEEGSAVRRWVVGARFFSIPGWTLGGKKANRIAREVLLLAAAHFRIHLRPLLQRIHKKTTKSTTSKEIKTHCCDIYIFVHTHTRILSFSFLLSYRRT